MQSLETYKDFINEHALAQGITGLFLLLTFALLMHFAARFLILPLIRRALHITDTERSEEIVKFRLPARLMQLFPALIIIIGIKLIPNIPPALSTVIYNVTVAFVILTAARALATILDITNALYMRRPDAGSKPIKGYIQVLKIAIFLVTAILIIAALIDKSPLILLSGLGAMAAVLMLVFQDTLLSLVASIQISSSDMVRLGDWIEMPNLNADGDVIDIALHTVKVRNWDKTITTVPTRRLISDPFKNWRGMQESGGRRIKRALHIDQNSIHFLTAEEKEHLSRFRLLAPYLKQKEEEISAWNATLAEDGKFIMNTRRITNIGTFRAYVNAYLRDHKEINQDMTLLVRQLAPGANGLPLEIYCFTSNTAWAIYEGVQSDIFDHLYSILPAFGLRAFQSPSGQDLKEIMPLPQPQ